LKTGFFIVLLAISALASKRVLDGKRPFRREWIYASIALACWIAIGIVSYGTP
jgi:hypothetical protein